MPSMHLQTIDTKLREMSDEEPEALMGLYRKAFPEGDMTPGDLLEKLSRPRTEIVVIDRDGTLVAFAIFETKKRSVMIDLMVSSQRRVGFGTMMLRQIERQAAEAGCDRIEAIVPERCVEACLFLRAQKAVAIPKMTRGSDDKKHYFFRKLLTKKKR